MTDPRQQIREDLLNSLSRERAAFRKSDTATPTSMEIINQIYQGREEQAKPKAYKIRSELYKDITGQSSPAFYIPGSHTAYYSENMPLSVLAHEIGHSADNSPYSGLAEDIAAGVGQVALLAGPYGAVSGMLDENKGRRNIGLALTAAGLASKGLAKYLRYKEEERASEVAMDALSKFRTGRMFGPDRVSEEALKESNTTLANALRTYEYTLPRQLLDESLSTSLLGVGLGAGLAKATGYKGPKGLADIAILLGGGTAMGLALNHLGKRMGAMAHNHMANMAENKGYPLTEDKDSPGVIKSLNDLGKSIRRTLGS